MPVPGEVIGVVDPGCGGGVGCEWGGVRGGFEFAQDFDCLLAFGVVSVDVWGGLGVL